VNPFGSTTAAAFAAAMQLWNYVQMPALALSAAVSSMAAQNIGAGFWDRVREIARTGVGFNFLMTGIPILLLYLLNKHAVGLFLPSGSPSLEIAVHLNRIILWSFVMFGVSMVLSGVMRAAGAVIAPLLFLFISLWVIRVPLSFWAADRYGPDGIWWSFALSAFLSMVMAAAYYLHGGWKRARMTASSAAGPATASGGEGG
jgi:Na+-driven multidrug efflux pump